LTLPRIDPTIEIQANLFTGNLSTGRRNPACRFGAIMKLNCIHCGGAFSVRTEQMGRTVVCPHCQGAVSIPKAADQIKEEEQQRPVEPSGLMTNSISALTSTVFHILLFILVALFAFDEGRGPPGDAQDVLIGVMPNVTLTQNQMEEMDSAPPSKAEEDSSNTLVEEVPSPSEESEESSLEEFTLSPKTLSGSSSSSFDLGVVSVGGGSGGGGGNWDGLVQQLRRGGLDIVIVFDSTGSMGGEIRQVKDNVRRIGNSLIKLVPKARISLVTYRDAGDAYVVQEPILPLTGEIQQVESYLEGVEAGGGGDQPEAVHEGLRYAIEQNEFRAGARKVILLFGDAPPHSAHFATCLRLASDFSRQNKGVVSTVTCRGQDRLKEFVEIAQVGGGEAFLNGDQRQIMTQLMILVFGSQYRSKVLEAFEFLEK
jgi:hypothetical protein